VPISTLDYIADLIAALQRDDANAFARALIRLEARMGPDDIADMLAAVLDDKPPAFQPAHTTPGPVPCA
jgi:hypothetical protein